MNKIIISLLFLIIALTIYKTSFSKPSNFENYQTNNAVIGNKTYKLYVADTNEKRNKGLSGVKELNPNEGMMFVFPQKGRYQFWMKNMNFDLDLIFLDGDKVVDVIEDVKASSYPQIYQGKVPYDKVVELPKNNQIYNYSLKKIEF